MFSSSPIVMRFVCAGEWIEDSPGLLGRMLGTLFFRLGMKPHVAA